VRGRVRGGNGRGVACRVGTAVVARATQRRECALGDVTSRGAPGAPAQ
jgi:hypothetical protein